MEGLTIKRGTLLRLPADHSRIPAWEFSHDSSNSGQMWWINNGDVVMVIEDVHDIEANEILVLEPCGNLSYAYGPRRCAWEVIE